METTDFDAWTRNLQYATTRRAVAALLAGLVGIGPAVSEHAAGRKKKRRCKAPKVKCGKQCLPAGSCCTDQNCAGDDICRNNACTACAVLGQDCVTGSDCCSGRCSTQVVSTCRIFDCRDRGACANDTECCGGFCVGGLCNGLP